MREPYPAKFRCDVETTVPRVPTQHHAVESEAMETHRPKASAAAQAFGPRLLGVPVRPEAFGFAPGWYRSSDGFDDPIGRSDAATGATVEDLAFGRLLKRINRDADGMAEPHVAAA